MAASPGLRRCCAGPSVHADRSSPTIFIPFAEQSGEIVDLGRWALEQACTDRQIWQQHSPAEIANIGQRVGCTSFHVGRLGQKPSRQSWPTRQQTRPLLTLEVTESVFVRDESRALVVLDEASANRGQNSPRRFSEIRILSSLSYPEHAAHSTRIKVDQSFIAQAHRSTKPAVKS